MGERDIHDGHGRTPGRRGDLRPHRRSAPGIPVRGRYVGTWTTARSAPTCTTPWRRSGLLAHDCPTPGEMPDDVAGRIDAALAAEAHPDTATADEPTEGDTARAAGHVSRETSTDRPSGHPRAATGPGRPPSGPSAAGNRRPSRNRCRSRRARGRASFSCRPWGATDPVTRPRLPVHWTPAHRTRSPRPRCGATWPTSSRRSGRPSLGHRQALGRAVAGHRCRLR